MSSDHLFDPFHPPAAPADLREKVLTAARSQRIEEPHWIDRIWESRLLRASWATAVVCLCCLYFLWQPPRSEPEARRLDLKYRLIEERSGSTLSRLNMDQVLREVERGS